MDSVFTEGADTIGVSQGFKALHVVHGEISIPTEGGALTKMHTMKTLWRPSIMELAALVGGAFLTITLWGRGHPPIMVGVNPEIPGFRHPQGYLVYDPEHETPTYSEDGVYLDAAAKLGWKVEALYK